VSGKRNVKTFKGYVFVVFSGAVLLVAALFVGLQWGTNSTISAFGPPVTVRTIALVAGSAAGGVILYWMLRLFVHGFRILWKARRQEKQMLAAARRAERAARRAERQKAAAGGGAEAEQQEPAGEAGGDRGGAGEP